MQPQMTNIYNRNLNTAAYYQPPPIAASTMPLYSTTVSNSPLTMMNYFNPPSNTFNRNQHENSAHEGHSIVPQQPPTIPIDVVSSLDFNFNPNLIANFLTLDISSHSS